MNQSQGGLSCALTMLVKEIEPTPQVFKSGCAPEQAGATMLVSMTAPTSASTRGSS